MTVKLKNHASCIPRKYRGASRKILESAERLLCANNRLRKAISKRELTIAVEANVCVESEFAESGFYHWSELAGHVVELDRQLLLYAIRQSALLMKRCSSQYQASIENRGTSINSYQFGQRRHIENITSRCPSAPRTVLSLFAVDGEALP